MATIFAPFAEITAEEFTRATQVTYLGTVYGTMAALKRMVPRNRGTVVQVGSALAYRAIPLQSAYCGGKFAIRGFTDSVRTELLHDKSRVWISMVQLPALNTPQFNWCRSKLPNHPQPVPPIYQPEVPAEAVYWAAHHRRREITVGGSAVKAIVGNKLAPRFADWYLARTGYASPTDRGHADRPRPAEQPLRAGPSTGRDTRDVRRPGEAAKLSAVGDDAPRPDRRRRRRERTRSRTHSAQAMSANADPAAAAPHVLREYALLADGERGILVGPRGDFAWMCFPRWDDDAMFSVADRRERQLRHHPRRALRLGRLLRRRAA